MAQWYLYPSNYTENNTGVEGAGDFFLGYPSIITDGYAALGIMVLIWVALLGLMLAFGVKKALATSSFLCLILSVPLIAGGWLNPVVAIVFVLLSIVGALGSKEEML